MSITVNGTNGLTFNDGSAQNTAATGFGFKNRIINGAMGIWQRGTSGFTTGYNADRWCQINGTISAISQSSDVPSGYKYSLSMVGSSTPGIGQRIESVNCTDLVGQNVTISFWAKQSSGAGSGSIALNLYYANSSDTFASITQIGSGQSFTGTSGWVQYTATFTSLPSGAANGLGVYLYSNVSGSSTTLITGVQLEKGSTATAYDYRPYGTELALCQRYYQKFTGTTGQFTKFGAGVLVSSTVCNGIAIPMKVSMRTQPAISGSGFEVYDGAVTRDISSYNNLSSPEGISFDATCSGASFTAYRPGMVGCGLTTDYLEASAEL